MLEHISLCHNNHKDDTPSCATIEIWLSKLLIAEFKGKDILLMQLKNAKYELINGSGFISIKFYIRREEEPFPFKIRVPIEMIAFQEEKNPIIFLLHVLNGYIDELEVFSADSSLINGEISLEKVNHMCQGDANRDNP